MGKYPYYKHLYETLIHMSHGLYRVMFNILPRKQEDLITQHDEVFYTVCYSVVYHVKACNQPCMNKYNRYHGSKSYKTSHVWSCMNIYNNYHGSKSNKISHVWTQKSARQARRHKCVVQNKNCSSTTLEISGITFQTLS